MVTKHIGTRHLSAAVPVFLLAACGGGGSSNDKGTGQVSLTDAPACGYDHVFVTVSKVSINSSTDGSGNWVDTDLAAPQKIDLLDLTNGALESTGKAALSAGTYHQARLILAPNAAAAATPTNSVVPSARGIAACRERGG